MEKESISSKSKAFGQLNKVTLLSKILAGTLFVTLPVLLFWVGYNQGYSQGLASGGYIQQAEDLIISQTTNPTDTVSPSTTLTPTPLLILNPLTDKYYFLETLFEDISNNYEVIGHKITEVNPDGKTRLIYTSKDSRYWVKASLIDANTIGVFNHTDYIAETVDLNTLEVKVVKNFRVNEFDRVDYFSWIDKNSFVYTFEKADTNQQDSKDERVTTLRIFANGIDKELKVLEFNSPQTGRDYVAHSMRLILSPDKNLILITTPNGGVDGPRINKTRIFDLNGVEKLSIEKTTSPEWIDNSSIVYTSTEDGNLYKINIVSKAKELLLNTSNKPSYGMRHRNGKLIYWRPYDNENAVVYLFDLKSKTEKRLTNFATEAEWLNDNEIYYTRVSRCFGTGGKCDQNSYTRVGMEKLNINTLESDFISDRAYETQIFSLSSKRIDDISCDNSSFCVD